MTIASAEFLKKLNANREQIIQKMKEEMAKVAARPDSTQEQRELNAVIQTLK